MNSECKFGKQVFFFFDLCAWKLLPKALQIWLLSELTFLQKNFAIKDPTLCWFS